MHLQLLCLSQAGSTAASHSQRSFPTLRPLLKYCSRARKQNLLLQGAEEPTVRQTAPKTELPCRSEAAAAAAANPRPAGARCGQRRAASAERGRALIQAPAPRHMSLALPWLAAGKSRVGKTRVGTRWPVVWDRRAQDHGKGSASGAGAGARVYSSMRGRGSKCCSRVKRSVWANTTSLTWRSLETGNHNLDYQSSSKFIPHSSDSSAFFTVYLYEKRKKKRKISPREFSVAMFFSIHGLLLVINPRLFC